MMNNPNSRVTHPLTASTTMHQQYKKITDTYLKQWLPDKNTPPTNLHQAMHYVVFSGGKRIRAALTLAAACSTPQPQHESVYRSACAIELIHAYSLVHDDLPAMDNDDLRRGQPTCHIQFNEATAILCGDALHSLAFSLLSNPTNACSAQLVSHLANAAGSLGMCGGQDLDLCTQANHCSKSLLNQIHHLKTVKLIACSLIMGLTAGQLPAKHPLYTSAQQLGSTLGLAFQIQDDLFDALSNSQQLGKHAGHDAKHNKATYVSIHGIPQAQQQLKTLTHTIYQLTELFANSNLLAIIDAILQRNH